MKELDTEIKRLYGLLSKIEVDDDEYKKILDLIERMEAVKAKRKYPLLEKSVPVLISVGGSILGMLLIMHYEKMDIITTKAFGLVTKVDKHVL